MNKYALIRQVSKMLERPMREVVPIVNALFDCMAGSFIYVYNAYRLCSTTNGSRI